MSQFSVTVFGDDTPDVPNTGMLTTGETDGNIVLGTPTAFIPCIAVGAVIACVVFAVLFLMHDIKCDKKSLSIKHHKRSLFGILSCVSFIAAISCIWINRSSESIPNVFAAGDETLSLTVEDPHIDIEVYDKPVYAMAKSKITVKSGTDAGYIMGAYVDNGDLVSDIDSSNVIAMKEATDIGGLGENTWGIALSKPTDQDSTVFRGLSNLRSKPTTIKSTNSRTESNDITEVYYGIYVSSGVPHGTYTNTINYVAVANVTEPIVAEYPLTVRYETGVADILINGVRIADGSSISIREGDTVSVDMNVMTPSEYKFYSWSATTGVLESTSAKSTTFVMGSGATTLTANVISPIQNLNDSSCTTTASVFYDKRDGHTYTIQRLKDGNCWMMENLDLGRTDLTTDLTSENTNLSNTVAASTFNSWKKTTGTETFSAGEFIPIDASNSIDGLAMDTVSGTAYGTLYNYYAASAGTITGDTNSSDALYDICPAGWRLPTGGDAGEFNALYAQYNSYALMRAPIAEGGAAFALSGASYNPSIDGQGRSGRYWASNWSGTDDDEPFPYEKMYQLHLNSQTVYPSASYYRNIGSAIRCVLK